MFYFEITIMYLYSNLLSIEPVFGNTVQLWADLAPKNKLG